MKNLTILTVAAALCMIFNSCKKCTDCSKECKICDNSVTVCRYDYTDLGDYQLALQQYSSCVSANEEDEVCTSGLFYKLRHESDVDAKESEGFDCK